MMMDKKTKMMKDARLFESVNRELETHFNFSPVHSEDKCRDRVNQVIKTILKNYINIGYYGGVLPFKPVYNPENSTWRLEGGLFQQTICGLLWTTFWFNSITESVRGFVATYNSANSLKAISYFSLLSTINVYLIALICFKILLTKRKCIEKCLNHALLLENIDCKYVGWCQGYLHGLYLSMWILTILPLLFTTSFFGEHFKSPTENFRNYVKNGRYRFFMDIELTEFTTENVFLGLFEFFCRLAYAQVMCTIIVYFAGCLPVIMWLAVKDFEMYTEEALQKSGNGMLTTLWEIKAKYETLKAYSGSLNNIWSVAALVWVLDTILRAMMILNLLVSSRNIASIISVAAWTLSILTVLILSGETYRKMKCFKAKLLEEENYEMLHGQDKLLLKRMLKELDDQPIGIGATGFYNLNYGFTAQLLVASLTIFLVSFEKDDGALSADPANATSIS